MALSDTEKANVTAKLDELAAQLATLRSHVSAGRIGGIVMAASALGRLASDVTVLAVGEALDT